MDFPATLWEGQLIRVDWQRFHSLLSKYFVLERQPGRLETLHWCGEMTEEHYENFRKSSCTQLYRGRHARVEECPLPGCRREKDVGQKCWHCGH